MPCGNLTVRRAGTRGIDRGQFEAMSELRDPRVLFAAERTLLAWTRTALTLMAFGFAVERFNLFVRMAAPELHVGRASSWIGIALILLGTGAAWFSVAQYRAVLRTLTAAEFPPHYRPGLAPLLNVLLGLCGATLMALLLRQHL